MHNEIPLQQYASGLAIDVKQSHAFDSVVYDIFSLQNPVDCKTIVSDYPNGNIHRTVPGSL